MPLSGEIRFSDGSFDRPGDTPSDVSGWPFAPDAALSTEMSKKVTAVALQRPDLCNNWDWIEGIALSYRPNADVQVPCELFATQDETE
jgi:hypothetical protein